MKPHAGAAFLLSIATLHAAACETAKYTRVDVVPRVTLFQSAEGTPAIVNGNIVAISGQDATLIVDTGQFPGIAKRVIAELKAVAKPSGTSSTPIGTAITSSPTRSSRRRSPRRASLRTATRSRKRRSATTPTMQ